jgi:hypothetical protein
VSLSVSAALTEDHAAMTTDDAAYGPWLATLHQRLPARASRLVPTARFVLADAMKVTFPAATFDLHPLFWTRRPQSSDIATRPSDG